ncbi:hypothetical protein ADK86_14300 [Streptomyces sp. NRRL F-5755]|uniref:DUF4232 domain-containing protein n=1 Tax=Streptomyces sp. NRRL F-5755 TaxID=1519475 RepID=UPI0006AFCD60|nr:DUF4232 domain-containing protein [Streptomyces sp. NRRL F-5755]KOU00480.1 hypothetical protein ADK86_14300 [Streptomyces sp. NRRL F-5755]
MRFHRPARFRPRPAVTSTAALFTSTAAALVTFTSLATATASATTPATSATRPCPESALKITASALTPQHPDVLRISATNRTTTPCAIDRIPTVTFGDLDGAAQPDPPAESAPYRLAPGATAHATVRTVTGRPSPSTRTVDHITVAADPAHHGRRFGAAALGAPHGIRVWSPTTTWWRPTAG